MWRKPYSWTRNYRLPIRPQYNVWVCWAPFRCWKPLPVSAKSKVLKFHVHSVHKRFPHRFTDNWKVVLTSDSHFRPNRMWKYGGNHIVELATMDFLFDLNTMYGSIGYCFDAGNYFHFGEIESTEIPRPFSSQTLPHRFTESGSNLQQSFSAKPEVEIWRKPYSWTRNYGLPVRPQYNVWTYLERKCWNPTSVALIAILDRFASICKVLLTSDSHFRQNRMWKYGGNHIVELATVDFLFHLNTMYGSIGHRFDAGNYFRFR